jgi:polyketide cyclase/dehydrase/lipid transport protein
MLRHEFSMEVPHSPARIWALLHDYERWTEWSDMVDRVDVLWPGDADHNGRLRRVWFKLPGGRTGASLELVTEAVANRGHTYTMLSRDGNDHIGHVKLEPLGSNRTLLSFDEEAEMDPAVYAFINKHNEDHLIAASDYLTAHPEYHAELADAAS